MGKKWKKKYKRLKKSYDSLFCEYIRAKTDDGTIKAMPDEQILQCRETISELGKNLANALKHINH